MKRFPYWVGLFFMASLCICMSGSRIVESKPHQRITNTDHVGLGVGYRPPEFSVVDLQGQPHTLKQYQGQVLVLHFWAHWCPYYRSEIPELMQLYRERGSKGVQVLTVSTDQEPAKLRQFVKQSALPYPIVADAEADSPLADQYGISGIPMTYVITRDGYIAARLNGASDITDAVERALDQDLASSS